MFETKRGLREEIMTLNAAIAGKEWSLRNAQRDVQYYRGKMHEYAGIIDELREENEELKQRLNVVAPRGPLYCSDVWRYICDAHKANETIRELEREVARLQDKLRDIGKIVEE